MRRFIVLAGPLLMFIICGTLAAGPLGSAFTYQGELQTAGEPTTADCDFRFTPFAVETGGDPVAGQVELTAHPVVEGIFTTSLDFGPSIFDGQELWISIAVRCPTATGDYQLLSPRQPITPAPYAIRALNGSGAFELDGSNAVFLGGNVGIGTSSPGSILDLRDNTSDISIRLKTMSSWTAQLRQTESSILSLINGGSEKLSITPNGRYGFNTTTPAAMLHAIGNQDPGLRLEPSSDSGEDTGIEIVGARNASTNTDAAYIDFNDFDSNEGAGTEFTMARIGAGMADVSGQTGFLRFYTNAGADLQERMRIDKQGDVSIGGGVDVAGSIVGNGTITGEDGLRAGNTSGDGLYVHQAGAYGSTGTSGASNGVEIRSAANDGLMVGASGGDGIDIWNSAGNGLYVRLVHNHGVLVQNALQDGIHIMNVGGYAINAADGINTFAEDTGIGVANPSHRLHVVDDPNGAASTANHVALIENNTTGSSADILVIKMPETGNDVGADNNYISFHDGAGNSLGAIEGNAAGSVVYAGAGNDYAEYLLRIDPAEEILPGDLVGVFGGRVSRQTNGADLVLAASTGAIVAGNDPGEENRDAYTLVAFMGQAELRVRGPVLIGDLIVPSGLGDGVGIAIGKDQLDAELAGQVVGQAWESSAEPRVKPVRSLVGLVQSNVMAHSLRTLEARVQRLERAAGMN